MVDASASRGCRERRTGVCRALPCADGCGFRSARHGPEAGRTIVTAANIVGLVLAVLLALLLGAALIFPERF
ncbi:hypothetical protein BST37_20955 [Mycobacterium noviomagense]|uniref:K+-transporting ATPase subunit F n=1 Tax=Mycobacterium noviomagense TaxID=459858 RepID=A0ABX3T0Z7_9MYCO|nr:hypothetical protein BST37_20955 [Mycobacterium noviomagense]